MGLGRRLCLKPRLHEHQVPNPDPNLDHNPHGRGGLSLDLNPVCLRVNTTNLDQNPHGKWDFGFTITILTVCFVYCNLLNTLSS